MDLEALENEFAANSWPKTAEKTELLLKLVPLKTGLLLSFFLDDPVVAKSQILRQIQYLTRNKIEINGYFWGKKACLKAKEFTQKPLNFTFFFGILQFLPKPYNIFTLMYLP